MEKYKTILKKRQILLLGFMGLAISFILFTGIFNNIIADGTENVTAFINGFQVGISIALLVMMFIPIVKYGIALKSEIKLKKLYVEEHDERKKLIQDKIGGAGFIFTFGAIATATVMAGFLNQVVFTTLLGVLIFMALVKGFLKVYYRNKF